MAAGKKRGDGNYKRKERANLTYRLPRPSLTGGFVQQRDQAAAGTPVPAPPPEASLTHITHSSTVPCTAGGSLSLRRWTKPLAR